MSEYLHINGNITFFDPHMNRLDIMKIKTMLESINKNIGCDSDFYSEPILFHFKDDRKKEGVILTSVHSVLKNIDKELHIEILKKHLEDIINKTGKYFVSSIIIEIKSCHPCDGYFTHECILYYDDKKEIIEKSFEREKNV